MRPGVAFGLTVDPWRSPEPKLEGQGWTQSEHSCSTPSADSAPELSAQLWSATLEYENLLNIQKEQHQLEVRRMEAESFRLRQAVHSLQAGASLEGYVPAQLQMKEEEQRLLLEAKQKELELMSSLVRVRDQQIRELQRVVPKAREEPEARLVADLRRDKAQLEQQLLAKDRQLTAVQGLDPAMSDASALQLGAKAIQMFHDSMQMKQDSAILSRENEDLRKEVESLQLRVQELDGRVAEKRAEVKELTSTISGKMKRTLQLEEQVEALQRERHLALSGSQFQLHKVQEQLAAAQRESRAAQQLAADLKAEVAERDQRFVRQQAACTEHETCAQEMQQRVEELRGKLAKAEEAMRQLRQSGAFKDQLLRDMTEQVQASENKLHSFQMGELIAGSRPAGAFAPPAVEALEVATLPKSPKGAPGAKAAEELRSASQKSPRRMSSPDSGTMSGARLSSFPAISSVLLSESYRPHPGDPLDQQVAEFVNQPLYSACKALFCRLGAGSYLFGSQRVLLRLHGRSLEAWVNSAWMPLEDFVRQAQPSQAIHLQPSPPATR